MPRSTKKCPECVGCMALIYVDNSRYFYCEFCRTYYGGKEPRLVDNPYLKEGKDDNVSIQEDV